LGHKLIHCDPSVDHFCLLTTLTGTMAGENIAAANDDPEESPRFPTIDWSARTSNLLSSLENSSSSLQSTGVAEGTTKVIDSVITAGGNTKKNGHILRLRAGITVYERDITQMKHTFGLELFAIMDRNRNMGDKSGGEAEPVLVEVFTSSTSNVTALLELRKRKQTELLQHIKPEAICYQSTGDDTSEDLEKSDLEDMEEEKGVTSFFSRAINKGMDWTRTALENKQIKNTLKSEIAELDKDMIARKEQFGIDMYDTMEYLGDHYQPRDIVIKNLLESSKTNIDVPFRKILTAEKELEDLRIAGTVLVSKEELQEYIDGKPQLWLILEANIQLGEEQCKTICIRVITELISGLFGNEARGALIRKRDFQRFEREYVDDPKGSQGFIHRCLFASFDMDHNGILNAKETVDFVDAFYKSGSVYQGNSRLPEKRDLMIMIRRKYGGVMEGQLTFQEIQEIIRQNAVAEDINHMIFEPVQIDEEPEESGQSIHVI